MNVEDVRKYLKENGEGGSVLVHNPTGLYYIVLGSAIDVDKKGRVVTIMRSLPSGRLFVTEKSSMDGKTKVDGKMVPRFSNAIDDDNAINEIIKYLENGFRI